MNRRNFKISLWALMMLLIVAACGSQPKKTPPKKPTTTQPFPPKKETPSKGRMFPCYHLNLVVITTLYI